MTADHQKSDIGEISWEGIFPANSQTPLCRNKIKMKSGNASTDIAIFEYNFFCGLYLGYPDQKKKISKKLFQKQIITNETLRIQTKKQTLDNGGFYFNIFFQNVSGEAILQDTTRESLLFLALLLFFYILICGCSK